MTGYRFALASALLILVPVTAGQAAGHPDMSSGMLGNHPATIAHLWTMPPVAPPAAPSPVLADLAQHPAVIVHSLMLGGVVDRAAAPQVKTAFTHVDRSSPVQIAANR